MQVDVNPLPLLTIRGGADHHEESGADILKVRPLPLPAELVNNAILCRL